MKRNAKKAYNEFENDLLSYFSKTYELSSSELEKEGLPIREEPIEYKKNSSYKKSEPMEFELQTTTVWSFPKRGNWATHSGDYRGNWSPEVPRNIILRYSKENEIVLDPFVGSGTTLIETKLLKRQGIGIDINKNAIEITKKNIQFNKVDAIEPILLLGNALNLKGIIQDNSIDLVCTHPPYANIIKYSDDILDDLSRLNIDDFLIKIDEVSKELFRVLKPNKYCAILIGDTRRNNHIVPLGFNVMQVFQKVGFILKEIIIKQQHNCKMNAFWSKKSIENNFLLIAHEYLLVFRKP